MSDLDELALAKKAMHEAIEEGEYEQAELIREQIAWLYKYGGE